MLPEEIEDKNVDGTFTLVPPSAIHFTDDRTAADSLCKQIDRGGVVSIVRIESAIMCHAEESWNYQWQYLNCYGNVRFKMFLPVWAPKLGLRS